MIVYNISIKVNKMIETEWVQWQKTEHIPEVMSSRQFFDYRFFRLVEDEVSDGVIYIVQYFAESMQEYNQYVHQFASGLRQKAFDKWGNQFIAFRTIMQSVD